MAEIAQNCTELHGEVVGDIDPTTQQRMSFEPFISREKWSAFRKPWGILRREHISKWAFLKNAKYGRVHIHHPTMHDKFTMMREPAGRMHDGPSIACMGMAAGGAHFVSSRTLQCYGKLSSPPVGGPSCSLRPVWASRCPPPPRPAATAMPGGA